MKKDNSYSGLKLVLLLILIFILILAISLNSSQLFQGRVQDGPKLGILKGFIEKDDSLLDGMEEFYIPYEDYEKYGYDEKYATVQAETRQQGSPEDQLEPHDPERPETNHPPVITYFSPYEANYMDSEEGACNDYTGRKTASVTYYDGDSTDSYTNLTLTWEPFDERDIVDNIISEPTYDGHGGISQWTGRHYTGHIGYGNEMYNYLTATVCDDEGLCDSETATLTLGTGTCR